MAGRFWHSQDYEVIKLDDLYKRISQLPIENLAALAGSTANEPVRVPIQLDEPLPLTAPQARRFASEPLKYLHTYTINFFLELPAGDPELVYEAMRLCIAHHEALRIRLYQSEGRWWQRIMPPEEVEVPLSICDLSALPDEELEGALFREAQAVQQMVNILTGPILAARYFLLGPERPAGLFVAVNHLVSDGVSQSLLKQDLRTAYTTLARKEAMHLPTGAAPYHVWVQELYARAQALDHEVPFWLAQIEPHEPNPLYFFTRGRQADPEPRFPERLVIELSATETNDLLNQLHHLPGIQVHDVLTTAVAHVLTEETHQSALFMRFVTHGRISKSLDVTRTMGYFSSYFPLRFSFDRVAPLTARLHAVQEQLRTLPQQGMGYELLCYCCQQEEIRNKLLLPYDPPVKINYMHQISSRLHYAMYLPFWRVQTALQDRLPWQPTQPILWFVARLGERLVIRVEFRPDFFDSEEIRSLAQEVIQTMRRIVKA